ncbi:KpsF/GutQ family sugar-phosphate isomerase [Neorhodopirellula pilleata]|uniref:KpsF/GutQ family sugar-phosphate isomerase n=1 Tax=Neorhodopirellula pilleata TaxID=2714738 RepID=UPI0018CDAE9C|nr:KpsF/GutQ family sugar-phosphate isomerase [Neorhodopirellula pilleata]
MKRSVAAGSRGSQEIRQMVSGVLTAEKIAIEELVNSIDDSLVEAIELLLECKRHIVVTGLGKSGLVGRKIAASFSSTGSPAYFLHASEALHGDVGSVGRQDILLAISNSGETAEVVSVAAAVRNVGCKILAMTGRPTSTLAKIATKTINVGVSQEADLFDLVPSSSTTATMAMGDAIALALCQLRQTSKLHLAQLHPAGMIGRRLLTRVSDVMLTKADVPIVEETETIANSLLEMTQSRMGAVLICDTEKKLLGIFTDGDLRRLIQEPSFSLQDRIGSVMSRSPKFVFLRELAQSALHVMEINKISVLPVVDEDLSVTGIIHMHQVLSFGITS